MFDLPSSLVSTVAEHWEDGYMKLAQCDDLPELLDRPSDYYQRQWNNDKSKSFFLCSLHMHSVTYASALVMILM